MKTTTYQFKITFKNEIKNVISDKMDIQDAARMIDYAEEMADHDACEDFQIIKYIQNEGDEIDIDFFKAEVEREMI